MVSARRVVLYGHRLRDAGAADDAGGEGRFPAFVNMYFPRNEKKNFNSGYFETVYLFWDGTEKEFTID